MHSENNNWTCTGREGQKRQGRCYSTARQVGRTLPPSCVFVSATHGSGTVLARGISIDSQSNSVARGFFRVGEWGALRALGCSSLMSWVVTRFGGRGLGGAWGITKSPAVQGGGGVTINRGIGQGAR